MERDQSASWLHAYRLILSDEADYHLLKMKNPAASSGVS